MKLYLLIVVLFSCSVVFAGEVVEVGTKAYRDNETARPLGKALKNYIIERYNYKKENLKNIKDVLSELTSEDDKAVITSIYKKYNDIKLSPGQFDKDVFQINLGRHTLSVEGEDYLSGVFRINKTPFYINNYKNLSELFIDIEKYLENDRKNKAVSLINLFIDSAHAGPIESVRYGNIVKMNAAGVIYLTVSTVEHYRRDVPDVSKLLKELDRDVKNAKEQCLQQRLVFGVSGDVQKYYGVLNESTRKNLETIVDKSSDEVTEELVLRGLFARYSGAEDHSKKSGGSTCMNFMDPFIKFRSTFKYLIEKNICPEIELLKNCLAGLYQTDKKYNELGRGSKYKKYSGDEKDNGTNYLDQINVSGK